MAVKGEPITTKFSVDISELKAGIQEANRQIKLANSEFKAAASGMDDWGNSADGLSAKLKQLNTVHEAETKKLDLLKQQYAAVVEEQGETSAAAQNLLVRINNQQAAVNKTAAEMRKYQNQLDSLGDASEDVVDVVEDQRNAYEKLQDTVSEQESDLKKLKAAYSNVALEQGDSSDAAKELAGQISKLSSEITENKTKMKAAEDAADSFDSSLDDLEKSAEETGDGFTILKGTIATFAGNVLTSAAGKLREWGASLMGLSAETREYRAEMAKLNSAAKDNAYSVDYAKSRYMDLYGVLADETAANTTISNFMAMGASTETLDSLLNSSIGIWAKYGDSIPLDGLAESVNETAKVAQVTGNLADALNWGAASTETFGVKLRANTEENKAWNEAVTAATSAEDYFNLALQECSTEQERQQLIASTLNSIYGDLSQSYQENNESVMEANKAQAALADQMAIAGARIEPITTAITRGLSNIIRKALELTENMDLSAVNDALEAGFSGFINDIMPKIVDGFTWILNNKDSLIAGIKGIATAFIAFKAASAIASVVSAFQTLFTTVKAGTGVMAALNAVMKANPIILIVSLIAGLIMAFIHLWNTSEGFRNFWIGLWDAIVNVVTTVVNSIVNFFTVTLPGAIQSLIQWFAQLPTNISNFVNMVWTTVTTWVSNMVSKALELGQTFLTNVVNFFQQLPERIGYFIGFALGKVVEWVSNMISKAIEVGTNFISNVVNFFQELPTKIWNFLSQAIQKVIEWGKQTVSTGKQKASEFIESVISFIKELPTKIWTWLSDTVQKVIEWGSNMISQGKQAASDLVDGVVDTISSLPDKMLSIGSDIVHGIWNGISGAAGWLWDQVTGFANNIVSGFKDALGISSPSKVFEDESKWIPGGVGSGINKNTKLAINPLKNMAAKMKNEAKKLGETVIPVDAKASLSSSVRGLKRSVSGSIQHVGETAQTVKEIVFNQYNNSPKALSRLDVYRQTKSQLFAAKRRLGYV